MSTIFTKIINREIPAYVISENSKFIAFLDISPLSIGHTLVVPKKEIDHFFDLDDDFLSEILLFSKKISKAIKKFDATDALGAAICHFYQKSSNRNTKKSWKQYVDSNKERIIK